jgi:hypothetical protein
MEIQMDKIMEVTAAIMGTTLVALALNTLVPEGMWLYLVMLVVGTQFIGMAIRSALK